MQEHGNGPLFRCCKGKATALRQHMTVSQDVDEHRCEDSLQCELAWL